MDDLWALGGYSIEKWPARRGIQDSVSWYVPTLPTRPLPPLMKITEVKVSKEQQVFRKGKGCMDMIFAIKIMVE